MSTPVAAPDDQRLGQALCSSGYWCSAGKAIACGVGTYSDLSVAVRDSAESCTQCPPDSTTRFEASTSREECLCNRDFFMTEEQLCERCPLPGSNCTEPGSTLEMLWLEPGYWRLRATSVDVRACPDWKREEDSACTGSPTTPCKPGLSCLLQILTSSVEDTHRLTAKTHFRNVKRTPSQV